jgi:transposase
MPLIPNMDRNQIHMLCFEELVAAAFAQCCVGVVVTKRAMAARDDSMVRVIDAFCSSYNPTELGFGAKGRSYDGRPAFSANALIRIYIYGYLNKIRSSRDLEKACRTNIELWWLTGYQIPCYKTIADFRKNNATGFKNLLKHFREFCKQLNLYGKDIISIDGSKFRAQNSKKNNFNQKKIDQHL